MRTTLLISCAATALLIAAGSASAQTPEHKSGPGLSKESGAAATTQAKPAMAAGQGTAEHRSAAEAPKGAKASPEADLGASAKPNRANVHEGAANNKTSPNTRGAAANGKNSPTAAQSSSTPGASPQSQAAEHSKPKSNHSTAQRDRDSSSASEPKTGRSAATGKSPPGKTGSSASSTGLESGRSATSTTSGAGERTNATTQTGASVNERSGSATSAQIDPQKQERIRTALSTSKVENIKNVDFSVSVGTRIPERYHFHPLPTEIVDIVPEYRGFDYMVVDNEVVIVNPRTREIVYTMSEGRSAGMNRPSVDCR